MKNGQMVWVAICDGMWRGVFVGLFMATFTGVVFVHNPAIKELKARVSFYEGQQEANVIQMRQFASDLARVRQRLPPLKKDVGGKGEAAGDVEPKEEN